MNTQSMEHNTSLLLYVEDNVDYGYEDHSPDPRYLENADFAKTDNVSSSFCTFRSPSDFSTNSLITGVAPLGDATEVSQSPSHSMKNSWSRCAVTPTPNTINGFTTTMLDSDDDSEDEDSSDYDAVLAAAAMVGQNCPDYPDGEMALDAYPPMPPDRQARKQRSFHRRGGEVHGALLKSAVMASMSLDLEDSNDDEDDEKFPGSPTRFRNVRRESCQSSISLQSLQDALRSETSPRKRARRGQRRASFDDEEDDNLVENANAGNSTDANHNRDMAEASDLFDTMRVGNGESRNLLRASGGSNHLRLSAGSSHLRSSGSSRDLRASGSSHFRGSVGSGGGGEPGAAIPSVVPKREPPPRRVSRKTSYDSRVSDYDSDFDPDDWDE